MISPFKQKIMAATEFNFAPNTIDEYSRVYALLTRLVDEVEVLKAALERIKNWDIQRTDSPYEISSDTLAAHQKRWEDLK